MNEREVPENYEARLDDLFRAYREATEFGDGGANFMPAIWRRIESRRRNSLVIERVSRIFATGAAGLAILAGLFVAFAPHQRPETDTWVEALASDHLARNASYYEPVRLSPVVLRESGVTPPTQQEQK